MRGSIADSVQALHKRTAVVWVVGVGLWVFVVCGCVGFCGLWGLWVFVGVCECGLWGVWVFVVVGCVVCGLWGWVVFCCECSFF